MAGTDDVKNFNDNLGMTSIVLATAAGGDLLGYQAAMPADIVGVNGTVDPDNSSTTPLTGDAVFTGLAMDVLDVADISVFVFSDVDSATDGLSIQWSTDGTNWDETDVFSIFAGDAKIFAFGPRSRYMRVIYTNGSGAQAAFRLQTILRTTQLRGSSHRVADLISAEDDAELVLAVITGQKPDNAFTQFQATTAGNFKISLEEVNGNVKIDADTGAGEDFRHGVALISAEDGGGTVIGSANPLAVNVSGPLSSFGEMSTIEPTPVVQLQFPYNINSKLVISKENNLGTVTQSNDHAVIATGASATSRAAMESLRKVKYNAGQGALARFTSLFTAGATNSSQAAGIGDESDGFFFGYDGTAFGVLRRRGGSTEVQTLTVSTASTTAEDITITLDGVALTDVTVTNSNDVTVTAKEIADHDYQSAGNGWTATAVGDTVVFISFDAAAKAGSFTLSGAATAAGTFAETVAGVAATDTWTPQASWSDDVMDGTGPSLQTLDPTKGNVFQVQYQWLGYGLVKFFVENSSTGRLVLVHKIEYANANTSPSISNPTLPLCIFAVNTSNTSDIVVKSSSLAGFVEGREENLGISSSVNDVKTVTVTTEEPVLTFRVKEVYQGRLNRVRVTPKLLSLTSSLVPANAVTTFRIYTDAIPTNGAAYSDVDTQNSVVEFDIAATDFLEGTLITQFTLTKLETKVIDIKDIARSILPGQTVLITAQPSSANAGNQAGVSVTMDELF